MNNEVMSPQEIADYMKISKTTLYKLLKRGDIPARKVGNQWRVSKAVFNE